MSCRVQIQALVSDGRMELDMCKLMGEVSGAFIHVGAGRDEAEWTPRNLGRI